MGCTSSKNSAAPPEVITSDGSQKLDYIAKAFDKSPMMVMPVDAVLKMEHLQPHEKVGDQLVEWRRGMGPVIFVSQTWLRFQSPDDKDGCKLQLLQAVLKQAIAGSLCVESHHMVENFYGNLKIEAAELQQVAYVWFDIFSVPQANSELQARAIDSIPKYVALSSFFLVLAGAWRHENGELRDQRAWCTRGWCRLELLVNALSAETKPLMVANSPSNIQAYTASGLISRGWLYDLIGEGSFSFSEDKLKLRGVVSKLIEQRREFALSNGDLLWFRVMYACRDRLLTGLGRNSDEKESYEKWMAAMRFESVHDGKETGLTPLRFAVLADRTDLATEMLDRGADVEAPLATSAYPEFEFVKGETILWRASFMLSRPDMVSLLLSRGANPLGTDDTGTIGLHVAIGMGHTQTVDVLLKQEVPKPQMEVANMFGNMPLNHVSIFGRAEMFTHLLRTCPEQTTKWLHSTDGMGAGVCHQAVTTVGSVELLERMLDAKADPETVGPVAPPVQGMFAGADAAAADTSSSLGASAYFLAYGTRCSALHAAVFFENLGAISLLLDRGAAVDSRVHHLGLTPLMLAAIGDRVSIAQELIKRGAAIDTLDNKDRSAMKWATLRGSHGMVELLSKVAGRSGDGHPGTNV